ncbi:MAG: hypothetical protein HY869_20335 [Chloroflexi bacterium]|nr:hypothetical protein [Chloroflexota bacterium]
MKKWGVRLIAIYFFLWAIRDSIALANGTSNSFLHFYIGEISLDIMTPIQICLLLIAGFQLMIFDKNGRIWALVILCWNLLQFGMSLFFLSLTNFKMPLRFQSIFGDLDASHGILIIVAWMTLIFLVPLFYLLRNDVKVLFEPPTIPDIPKTVTDVKV